MQASLCRLRLVILLIAVPLASCVSGTQTSATSDAWFGVATPQGLSDPHRPTVDTKTTQVPPARVPAGEEINRELQGTRLYRDVSTIVDFAKQSHRAGDKTWGRVNGFPAAKATLDWAARQFKAAGLTNVEVQQYDAAAGTAMWWAKTWEARLIADPTFGSRSQDVVLASAVPTSGSLIPNGVLTAPLVYVGAVTDAQLADVDVKGKVAVQHLRPENGAFSERTRTVERAQALSKRGAVAVLNVVEQTANMHVRDFGNCGAPCFNLGTADGTFVEAIIKRAATPVSIQLQLDAERLTGLKGHNTVGIVQGHNRNGNDENIIVNAHADGWYDAAGDNADGLAVLAAMARHFAKPENKPERTLVFVASGGHHSTGLNGPANFVRMNPKLTAKTVLVLNLEHIAQLRIRSGTWMVEPTEQPMNFGIDNSSPAIIAIGKRGVERYGFNLNPTFGTSVSGDLGGYAPLGVARVQAIHSGPMYHTSGDVLETISVPGLERAARFYTYFVNEAAKTPRNELNPKAAP